MNAQKLQEHDYKRGMMPEATPTPNHQPDKTRVVRHVEQRKKKSLYSIKSILVMSALAAFGILFGQLYLDSQINRVHYEIQELRFHIGNQQIANDQLYAQISQLSMSSRVMEVASEHGLSMQGGNVIYIQN